MSRARWQLSQATGRFVGQVSRYIGTGKGSVLPGRVGLFIEPDLLAEARTKMTRGCIFVTGTNGKSTTTYYLYQILTKLGYRVCTNHGGANMMSGIAAACLAIDKPVDYGLFEVDEASLPRVASQLRPTHVIALNFSRDQLDRYAEIEQLIAKIGQSLKQTSAELLFNARNLYAMALAHQLPTTFGYWVHSDTQPAVIDRPICFHCRAGLLDFSLTGIGQFSCTSCGIIRQLPDLSTTYRNNLLRIFDLAIGCPTQELAETMTAALLVSRRLGLADEAVIHVIERTPPLPAHETTFRANTTYATTELVLAKNPESFNRQLHNLRQRDFSQLAIAINRNYADGLDTSWLWDVNFEYLRNLHVPILAAGQARFDVALRLKVAKLPQVEIVSDTVLEQRITNARQRLLILANYTAYTNLEHRLAHNFQRDSDLMLSTITEEIVQ